jgi:hypothetical protein
LGVALLLGTLTLFVIVAVFVVLPLFTEARRH